MRSHTPVTAVAVICCLLMLPTDASATIYRCLQGGHTVFADHPCGADAATVTVAPVVTGGRLDTGTRVEFYQPPPRATDNHSPTGCPAGYIQSSELRRLRVRRQVQTGLSADQVRYILGDPDHHDGQWWVYQRQGRETGRYLFRDGCLSRWR